MRKFLLRTLLYSLPVLAAWLWYLIFVGPQPPVGDLARLMGRGTRFHVKSPEPLSGELACTTPASACRDVTLDSFDGCRDGELVVFGDSFSAANDRIWRQGRWHQFMGRDIVYVGPSDDPVKNFLTALIRYPELLGDTVTVETVERYLVPRLAWIFSDEGGVISDEGGVKSEELACATNYSSLITPFILKNFELALQYWQHRLGINLAVQQAGLDSTFFTYAPTRLYYFEEDVLLAPGEWETGNAVRNLRRLDSMARAAGVTLRLVAIPDKYTAYRHRIVGDSGGKRLLEDPCPFDTLPCFVNTFPFIVSLLESGQADVYLPDDTHFSQATAKALGNHVSAVR